MNIVKGNIVRFKEVIDKGDDTARFVVFGRLYSTKDGEPDYPQIEYIGEEVDGVFTPTTLPIPPIKTVKVDALVAITE